MSNDSSNVSKITLPNNQTLNLKDELSRDTLDDLMKFYVDDGGYICMNYDGGGVNPPDVMEKTITTNGIYDASSDDVTGYSKVTVNVPTHSASKDVNFYDYNGVVVDSYSAADFANLSVMPANPTHTGLTAQGWNWSLADAKTYVDTYGKLNIGQMYVTSDGKTRLYISLPEGRTSPILQLYLNDNSELDIDWGDGSTHSTFTSISADYSSERHEYAAVGDYVIAITVVTGGFILQSSSTNFSSILCDGNTSASSLNRVYNNAVNKIEVGTGVTSIGTSAFYNCYSISSVTIPDTVTSIGSQAFYSCYSLASVTIPSSVVSIGNSAFSNCYSLSSVTISDTVTSIGNSAFSNCYALSSVTIPDNVTSIGSYAFYYCYSLTSITIPNTVTSIEQSTFNGCYALMSITIPDTITSIGTSAFNNCYSLASITIPDDTTYIGGNAFQNCYALSSITMSDTVTFIGSKAFYNCYSLPSVTIPDTVTFIGDNAFNECHALSFVTILGSGATIGQAAFYNCYSLSSITLPDTVTSIGNQAFYNCYVLSSITIPDSVTSIGGSIFYNCYALSSITIPDNVTSIGNSAFYNCSYMSFIKFEPTTPPTVSNSNVWSGVSTSTKILVPAEILGTYKSATNYPNPSSYNYIGYATYESGETLLTETSDASTALTWYASIEDWSTETNPITVGNGEEIYARGAAIVSVSRYVDFPNNTTTITGSPSSLTAYTGISRCNVADDGTINAYYDDVEYTEDGSNGQVMVKIPKFYYKVIPDTDGGIENGNIRKCTWKISDSSPGGFTLHPAFYDANGNEIDYFLYGAFDGVGQNSQGTYGTEYNTSSDKLSSVAGSTYLPLNTFTRATARTMAANRGAGWYQAAIKQTAAIQMLMAVEYGFNAQKAIGNGVVNTSGPTYAGQTTGNSTSGTTINKTTPVNWRGIENFWGNIWDWIDGLNTVDRVPYICAGFNFADTTVSGDTQLTFALPTEGYVTALGYDSNVDWIFLPSESSSTAAPAGPIGDYLYTSPGQCVAQFGGRWQRDQYAGAFFWCCNNGASKTGNDISARLMYIPTGAV